MSEHQTADLVLRTMQTSLVQLPPGSIVLSPSDVEKLRGALLMANCERHADFSGHVHDPARCRKCRALALIEGKQ